MLGLKTKVGQILSLLHTLLENSNAVLSKHVYILISTTVFGITYYNYGPNR